MYKAGPSVFGNSGARFVFNNNDNENLINMNKTVAVEIS